MSGDDLHAGISFQQRQQGGTVAVMLRIGELPALQGSVYQNDNGAFFRDVGEVALDPCELLLTETDVVSIAFSAPKTDVIQYDVMYAPSVERIIRRPVMLPKSTCGGLLVGRGFAVADRAVVMVADGVEDRPAECRKTLLARQVHLRTVENDIAGDKHRNFGRRRKLRHGPFQRGEQRIELRQFPTVAHLRVSHRDETVPAPFIRLAEQRKIDPLTHGKRVHPNPKHRNALRDRNRVACRNGDIYMHGILSAYESIGSVRIGLREPFPVGDDHARDAAPAAEDTSAYRFLGHRMLRKQKQYERHRTSQTRKERIHK